MKIYYFVGIGHNLAFLLNEKVNIESKQTRYVYNTNWFEVIGPNKQLWQVRSDEVFLLFEMFVRPETQWGKCELRSWY